MQSAVAIVTECGATSCGRVNAEVCVSCVCVCVLFELSLYHNPDLYQHPPHKHRQGKVAQINAVSLLKQLSH